MDGLGSKTGMNHDPNSTEIVLSSVCCLFNKQKECKRKSSGQGYNSENAAPIVFLDPQSFVHISTGLTGPISTEPDRLDNPRITREAHFFFFFYLAGLGWG